MVRKAPKSKNLKPEIIVPARAAEHGRLVSEISDLLEQSRRLAARSVNALLTATYWQIGRRILEHEQGGVGRAGYGEVLIRQLADDLTAMHGRGVSAQGLYKMRAFYLGCEILPTPSGEFEARAKFPTPLGKSPILQTASARS